MYSYFSASTLIGNTMVPFIVREYPETIMSQIVAFIYLYIYFGNLGLNSGFHTY
jgi:hypothetical protein